MYANAVGLYSFDILIEDDFEFLILPLAKSVHIWSIVACILISLLIVI